MDYDGIVSRINQYKYKPRRSELSVADVDGWTVAHYLAGVGLLPADFDDWALADNSGWSVAHQLARTKTMPTDFKHWGLVTLLKVSVLHVACSFGHVEPMSKTQMDKIWALPDSDGKTPWDVYTEYGHRKIANMKVALASKR